MAQNELNFPSRSRTQALGKLYKKITNEDMPAGANTTTEALQKVYEALTEDTKHHTNVTKIIDDLATNWSGGGGGSSDFSTATVTLVNNTDDYAVLEFPKVASLPSGTYTTASSPDGEPHTTEEVVIALAEDGCIVLPAGITGNIEVSGDATIGDRGMLIITGDCTITIS